LKFTLQDYDNREFSVNIGTEVAYAEGGHETSPRASRVPSSHPASTTLSESSIDTTDLARATQLAEEIEQRLQR
jgi:hypothetical protein